MSDESLNQQIRETVARRPPVVILPELDTDPNPPSKGALLYCIKNNGAGKREVRVQYATGAPVVVNTEA